MTKKGQVVMGKPLFNDMPAPLKPWLNIGLFYSVADLFFFGFQCLVIFFFGQTSIKQNALYVLDPFFGNPALALHTTVYLLFIAHLKILNRPESSARALRIIDALIVADAAALWAVVHFVTRPYNFWAGGYLYTAVGIGAYAALHLFSSIQSRSAQ